MYNAHCVEEISNRSWQASNMDALKNSLMTYHVEGVSGPDPQKKLISFTAVVWEQLADVQLAAETDSDWVNAASWRHVRALAHIATQPPHQHRSAAARWVAAAGTPANTARCYDRCYPDSHTLMFRYRRVLSDMLT